MAAFEHHGVSEGTVIALEGDQDVIDSQFRLLPSSPDVLTLPTLQALTVDAEDQPSGWEDEADVRAYILKVNDALVARHAQVTAFITGRDAGQRRLVLTNGGSARAQVYCINQIARRLTDGSLVEAERIYLRCAEDGVRGLKATPSTAPPTPRPAIKHRGLLQHGSVLGGQDPSTMDSSKSPVVTVQESAVDISPGSRVSNASTVSTLPDQLGSTTGHSAFTTYGDGIQTSSRSDQSHAMQEPDQLSSGLNRPAALKHHPVAAIHVTRPSIIRAVSEQPRSGHTSIQYDADQARHALLHPDHLGPTDDYSVAPRSPDLQSEFDFSEDDVQYEFGRAKVVQVRGRASRIPLRKTKSMDRVRSKSRAAQNRAKVLQAMQANLPAARNRLRSKSVSSSVGPGPRAPDMVSTDTQTQQVQVLDMAAQTMTTYLPDQDSYVDKAVHVVPEDLADAYAETLPPNEVLFEPVIPFQEDYIIQLFDGNEDVLLDDVLERFRRSLNPPSSLTIDTIDETPRTPGLESMDEHQSYSLDHDGDDFGQPGSTDSGGSWPAMDDKQQVLSMPRMQRLHSQKSKMQKNSVGTLSLSSTPPSMVLSPLERVIEIAYSGRYKPLDIQDCFRSVLDQYAPLRTFDPVDSFFGLQSSKLWKSTLSADSSFSRAEKRLDYVVAFGASEGVSEDLAEILHGRITQLGIKRIGLNKVITVEIRHLLGQVLQQVQATRASSEYQNVLNNPSAICELLVPYLEAHLSSEPGARLLVLRYSSETLPMVLNLRHVLSESFMKIAAVVDPNRSHVSGLPRASTYVMDYSNRRSHSNIRGQAESTAAVVSHSARSRTRGARSGTMSSASSAQSSKLFAQADFSVASTATEAELDEFISTIRAVLAQKNPFFEVEPEPEPPAPPKPTEIIKYVEKIIHVPMPMGVSAGLATTGGSYAEIVAASQAGQAAAAAAAANASAGMDSSGGNNNNNKSSGKHDRAWSFVPSLMPSRRPSNVSMTTTRSRRTQNGNGGPRDPNDPWELWHEDEEEDRMVQLLLNPDRPTRRPTNWRNPNKGNAGNSRKALKWLGIIG